MSAARSGVYAYNDSSFDQHQRFTFADGDVYPTLLDMTTPYTDWVCAAAAASTGTASSLAMAHATGAAALPKSPDTGDHRSFGPTPLPIPFALQQSSTSAAALHEIPAAAQLWGAGGYAEPANGGAAAVFGGTPVLDAVFADPLPAATAAGYDVAGAQVGLDEFINAL
jgi:hypothetical protein